MNKGFAWIPVVIVIALIAASVGWYATQHSSTATNTANQAATVAPTTSSSNQIASAAPMSEAACANKTLVSSNGLYSINGKKVTEGYSIEDNTVSYVTYGADDGPGGTGQAFYRKSPISLADPSTFSMFGGSLDQVWYDCQWGKDAKNVFWQGEVITPDDSNHTIDFSTIEYVPGSEGVTQAFLKDKSGVYDVYSVTNGWHYKLLPNVDPTTFTIASDLCAKDKNEYHLISQSGDLTPTSSTPIQCK